MHDAVVDAAQRQHRAMGKGRSVGQPLQPRRDPGAVFLRECTRLLQTAARRHGEHHLARDGMDAQRVAARLPVAAQAHQKDLAVEIDRDGRRLAGAAKQ